MPNRHTLIPIIWGPHSDIEIICRLLDKWRDKIADTLIVFTESIRMIESLFARTGRPLVPVIRINGIVNRMADFRPDTQQQEWVAYLQEYVEAFRYIQVGNCREEVHTEPNGLDDARMVREIAEAFPRFAGRLMVAPWHTDVLAEATAAISKRGYSPIRQAIFDCCDRAAIYCGCSLPETPAVSMWLQGLHVWSGIGYATGAESHSLKRLLDLGFEAAVFFLPIRTYDYESAIHAFEREPLALEERNRLMERYTTDIEV